MSVQVLSAVAAMVALHQCRHGAECGDSHRRFTLCCIYRDARPELFRSLQVCRGRPMFAVGTERKWTWSVMLLPVHELSSSPAEKKCSALNCVHTAAIEIKTTRIKRTQTTGRAELHWLPDNRENLNKRMWLIWIKVCPWKSNKCITEERHIYILQIYST